MEAVPTSDTLERRAGADPWYWLHPLATARPGRTYEVKGLLFSLVRQRCHRRGLHEGDEIACIENQGAHRHVVVRRPDGQLAELEREYAWFVQVEPLDGPGSRGPP